MPAAPRRATLADVARRAGVSRTTVSEILGRAGHAASPYAGETRGRVRQAARDLGYTPHGIAQRLARGRSGLVGLVLLRDFSNAYFARLADAVDREVRRRGLRLQLAVRDGDEAGDGAACARRDAELIAQMQADAVEGLIVGPVYEQLDLSQHGPLAGSPMPTVLLGGGGAGFDAVSDDSDQGRRIAVEHLKHLGHRRIGFLCAPPSRTDPTRTDHYGPLRVLAQAGVLAGPQWVAWQPDTGDLDDYAAAADAFAEQWLESAPHERPTAVLTLNDAAAMAALGTLARRGIDVPGDLSVIGYDGLPEAAHLVPPLTTLDADVAGQAARAVATLLDRVAEPARPPAEAVVTPRLLVRGSTAPPPPT